jgi:peptidoglycan hydrolase CwlO-like protein
MISNVLGSTPVVFIGSAVLAFLGGLVSSFLIFRGQKLSVDVQKKSANTEQVETIFTGYSQMVEDLQREVERLKVTIEDLRTEQEACEERNKLLETEIVDLQSRISIIEQREAEHHGE